MSSRNSFKVAMLAASIALAMGSTAVMAATAPTALQLPGVGTATGPITVDTITNGVQNINITGNAVINWGKAGGTINATQPGGFNIGSQATLNFTGVGAPLNSGVLNIDSSGNPSQIFGTLTGDANTSVFVANTNGIIVGAGAIINVAGVNGVNLIANDRGTINFDGTASAASIEYQGTGGNVTVAKGVSITGSVLVSGGGVVNVDLSAFTGTLVLNAGVKNSTSTLVNDNTGATLTAAGALGGATLASFASAGNASSSGTLSLGSNAAVAGTLTNTGTMDLGTGFALDGAVVNNKTMTQSANASMGSLVNNGAYTGGNFALYTTDGGITNGASMTGIGYVWIENGGDFVNNGQFVSNNSLDVNGGGNVTNNGQATLDGYVDINEGGNFTNAGTMSLTGSVFVLNGSIANSGKLGVDHYLETASDTTAGMGFTKGADYSITNTGTVTSAGNLRLSANSDYWGDHNGAKNDSTGSVSNTGTLRVNAGDNLDLWAYNDVNLAGTVQAYNGTEYAALSAANSLNYLDIYAGDYDGIALNTTGVATLATDIVTSGDAEVYGNQVKLMANLSAIDGTGAPNGSIYIIAGDKSATDYAVRVASGKTVLADTVEIDGDGAANPNVILQGTISGNELRFGYNSDGISDLFSGPTGSLVVTGSSPHVHIYFTGAVKAAPYLNNPGNFRYNYLSISAPDDQLYLDLDPVAYTTNGTSNGKSAVNLLVSGDVNLDSAVSATVHAGDSAVTGVANTPNTHLVLQASGNIEVGDGGSFYWPGYVYLGNVAADASGNALPGTLGLGTITTDGEFNNVLPGDIAGASGIHFITQFPMTLGGDVVTNANAWVNFGTDLMTSWAVAKQNGAGGPFFFGGTQGAGTVVNYGALDDSMFHTHAPVATK